MVRAASVWLRMDVDELAIRIVEKSGGDIAVFAHEILQPRTRIRKQERDA